MDDSITELLKALKRAHRRAVEDSIRTGVPLVVMRRGKIVRIPPKYKYIRVPIDAPGKAVNVGPLPFAPMPK